MGNSKPQKPTPPPPRRVKNTPSPNSKPTPPPKPPQRKSS